MKTSPTYVLDVSIQALMPQPKIHHTAVHEINTMLEFKLMYNSLQKIRDDFETTFGYPGVIEIKLIPDQHAPEEYNTYLKGIIEQWRSSIEDNLFVDELQRSEYQAQAEEAQ